MGAFVGNVTSPFMQRRKGRIGKDVIESLTAPTYAGGIINAGAGNYQSFCCALIGADSTYQENATKGAGPWTSRLLPGTARIGNSALASNVLVYRPFNEKMFLETWHMQCHFNGAGIITGTGGGLHQISPDGKTNKVNFSVPSFPLESVAWSSDGRCFLTAGAASAGVVQGRGKFPVDETPDTTEPVNWNIGAGQIATTVFFIEDARFDERYTFLVSHGLVPGQPSKRVARMKGFATWILSGDIAMPATNVWGNFVQIRSLILAFGRNNPNVVRSTNYGNPFDAAEIAVGAGGPIKGAFRYGNRVYCISRDAPRIRLSRNNGLTWETSIRQPPDAGVQLSCHFATQFFGENYLLGNDGAVNRFYRYRPYMDI